MKVLFSYIYIEYFTCKTFVFLHLFVCFSLEIHFFFTLLQQLLNLLSPGDLSDRTGLWSARTGQSSAISLYRNRALEAASSRPGPEAKLNRSPRGAARGLLPPARRSAQLGLEEPVLGGQELLNASYCSKSPCLPLTPAWEEHCCSLRLGSAHPIPPKINGWPTALGRAQQPWAEQPWAAGRSNVLWWNSSPGEPEENMVLSACWRNSCAREKQAVPLNDLGWCYNPRMKEDSLRLATTMA